MEPSAFLRQARVLIVAGKGGVGKTAVTATIACMAAGAGLRVLVIELEGRSGLTRLFGRADDLSYKETVLAGPAADATVGGQGGRSGGRRGEVRARTLTPDDALVEYLVDHGMRRISKRLSSTGTLDVVATAVPGIKDILVLGKVKQLERVAAAGQAGAADLLVVDAPAAGHAVQFLASARGLLDAVAVGPIRNQAADVVQLLGDPTRCQVVLVTVPEETPVNEVIETGFHLEDRAGVQLAPLVVNGVFPPLDLRADPGKLAAAAGVALTADDVARLRRAAQFRSRRQELQAEQMARLADSLPLPQLRLPYLFTTDLGPADVEVLAGALRAEVEDLAPAPIP